jgi:hypothetical protein
MVSLPLDVALSVLTLASILMAVQLIFMTVELTRLRRDVLLLLRSTSALNHAVNPWAGDDEPTDPDPRVPPRLRRHGRWTWFTRRE